MRTIRLMLLLAMLGLTASCTTFPRFYLGADEIHGKVVDAETKEPIKDVLVVAVWKLYGGMIERQHTGNLVLLETVTDENGNYSFDSWGPRFTISGYLEDESPVLIFYKLGYKSEWLNDYYAQLMFKDVQWYGSSYKHLEWSGKTLELKKFIGSQKDYADSLSNLDMFMFYDRWSNCDWKRLPRFTAAMIKVGAINIDNLKSDASRCGLNPGGVEKILGEYIND